jgi:hypothetical protein
MERSRGKVVELNEPTSHIFGSRPCRNVTYNSPQKQLTVAQLLEAYIYRERLEEERLFLEAVR